MKKIIVLLCLLCISSCSWFKSAVEPVVTNAIDCIKTEESAAAGGKDVFRVLVQVADALGTAAATAAASGGDVLAALDAAATPLIAQYGEPIVACVAKSLEPTTSSSASAKAEAPDVITQWIAHHGWTFK